VLAVWGANDRFFVPAGGEAFRTHQHDAEIVLLRHGPLPLVEELDEGKYRPVSMPSSAASTAERRGLRAVAGPVRFRHRAAVRMAGPGHCAMSRPWTGTDRAAA